MKRTLITTLLALCALSTASPATAAFSLQKNNAPAAMSPATTAPLGQSNEEEVPDPEQAFLLSASAIDDSTAQLRIFVADCCYLYRDKTKIELVTADGKPAPSGVRLGDYRLPPGKVTVDEFIGKTEIYRPGTYDAALPILNAKSLENLALKIEYQGCSEKPIALCYPPVTKIVPIRAAGDTVDAAASGAIADDDNAADTTFWFALLAAFGAGLLLTFTPCVLPMIPILSGIIVGAEGKHITKLRGGALSYVYVLGTAVTYAIAGAVAGATGAQLQSYFQNAWAIGIFSTILVLLALSMFGFYELQVPNAIQSLIHRHSSRLHERAKQTPFGEYAGVFVLGLLSALIIGACVSPVLISVLGAAIAAQDAVLGAGVMFALAHGQGLILVAVGIGEGALLPKAGPWMNTIKHVFGVMLLAVAIYLLGFLPQVPVLLLWGTLLIVCAVYLGATQRLPDGASGWRYLWKGVGTVLLIWGALALIGGFAGNRDLFKPLPWSTLPLGAAPAQPMPPVFERVSRLDALEQGFARAKASGKPVVLDYYADWCAECVRMERSTLMDAEVRRVLATRFVTLQADVTDASSAETKKLKEKFGVYGPPAMLFFASDGEEQRALRAYGYLDRDAFLALLERIR